MQQIWCFHHICLWSRFSEKYNEFLYLVQNIPAVVVSVEKTIISAGDFPITWITPGENLTKCFRWKHSNTHTHTHTELHKHFLPSWWCCSERVASLPSPTMVATVTFLVARLQCCFSFSSFCWMYSVASLLGVEIN